MYVSKELPRFSKAEQFCLKGVIRGAGKCFGETPADEFGPLKFRTVREQMVDCGWCRSFINKQTERLRKILRWEVSWEYVPAMIVTVLEEVKSLAFGDAL